MANILPWLFWCTSAAVTSLASADLLLLERQKKWISDRAIDLWDWLDDQRELKFLRYLGGFRWLRFVVIFYSMIALFWALFIGYRMYAGGIVNAEPSRTPYLGQHHLGLGVGSFLAALIMVRTLPHVLNWVTKTEAGLAYIGRSIPMFVAAIAGFFAFGRVVESLSQEDHQAGDPAVFLDVVSTFSDPITAIIVGFCLGFLFTFVFVMFMSCAVVVLPVVLLLLLMILFRVVQFVVVRVAENPKGPQYALSVLLAAVGAAISRFT